MDHLGFSYTVIAKISVSRFDVEHLREMAECHYDHKCKSLNLGLLRGWGNQFRAAPLDQARLEVEVTERELQTLCKVLEGPLANIELRSRFNQLLRDVHRELDRLDSESGD